MTQVAPANEIELYFQSLQQGSVLHRSVENAHAFAALGNDSSEAAVVSQTCDVVLPKRPTALLAPVVELHGEELRIARRRDNPRFVHLPRRGAAFFADLGHIHAIHKTALVGSEVTDGIDLTDDAEIRTLALAIGRWFSRFAFPDEVVPWLRPLLKVIREKYNKSQSPSDRCCRTLSRFASKRRAGLNSRWISCCTSSSGRVPYRRWTIQNSGKCRLLRSMRRARWWAQLTSPHS